MLEKFKLNDKEIRRKILEYFYTKDFTCKNTVIIEELDLCIGEARIDLALIKNKIIGIEIKSDKDSLSRLKNQSLIYDKVFDIVIIVVGIKHLTMVLEKIPDYWGVFVVKKDNSDNLIYEKKRVPKTNKNKDPFSVVQLLWKSEALSLLETKKFSVSFKNKSRDVIWDQLVKSFKKEELFNYVNSCLKKRPNWRFVHQPM